MRRNYLLVLGLVIGCTATPVAAQAIHQAGSMAGQALEQKRDICDQRWSRTDQSTEREEFIEKCVSDELAVDGETKLYIALIAIITTYVVVLGALLPPIIKRVGLSRTWVLLSYLPFANLLALWFAARRARQST